MEARSINTEMLQECNRLSLKPPRLNVRLLFPSVYNRTALKMTNLALDAISVALPNSFFNAK